MKQRLINEIRFAVLTLILTCFLDAHTIYASSDFLTYHMPSLFIEREETTNKTGSSMTTRLMMKHPESIILWEKNNQRYHEKSRRKKYEKYGQMPFQNSNIFHDNVHRLQIREKWARKANIWISETYRNPT